MTLTNKKSNLKNIAAISIFWTLMAVALFCFLQKNFSYHFYFIEQSRMFLWTSDYLREMIGSIGGLNLWIANFLLQFFIVPYCGAAIVTALLIMTGICTGTLIGRLSGDSRWYPLSLLPPLMLLFVQLNFNYYLEGTTAYLFAISSLVGYTNIKTLRIRVACGIIVAVLLYGFIGSAALLFAFCAALWEILHREKRCYIGFLPLVMTLIMAVVSVYSSLIGEFRWAMLPDFAFHDSLHPGKVLYYSWISLPVLMIFVWLFRNKKETSLSIKKLTIYYVIQAVIIGWMFYAGMNSFSDSKSLRLKKLDYFARTGQWDATIRECEGPLSNFLYKCHLNLALAHKGRLADDMFSFDQRGSESLIVPWNKVENISCLLSDIYYAMGAISSSQQMAFEGYVSGKGEGNVRMLKRLVQTNLIYGEYPVAEKYIKVLENTLFYKDWASSQRHFLYNDAAVMKDTELGQRRKLLPADSNLANINGFSYDLEEAARCNPSFVVPVQYLGAMYLLTKDLEGFKTFIDNNYGTETLPSLPKSFQEAIIVMSEKDQEYWKKFNLPDDMIQRFAIYKQQVLANKGNAGVANLLYRSFGDTYWHYYMFK